MGRSLPDHCLCCDLRPGVFVISGFVIALCFPSMVVLGIKSGQLRANVKFPNYPDSIDMKDGYWVLIYMYWLNAAFNALEILMTAGLIWGVYKGREKWLTRWLLVSIGWWAETTLFALAIIMAYSSLRELLLTTLISPFIYYMGYQSIRTVAGLRAEMLREGEGRAPDAAPVAPATDSERAQASADAEGNVQL